jgi:RNA 2',3'-cyclic 3'-phosphodiesterase
VRLFAAVWPDESALAHLEAALDPLRGSLGELRWQPRERWHLTLAFLGEVDEERLPSVRRALRSVAARHGPVDAVQLAGAGAFGPIVWVGLEPRPSALGPAPGDLARSLREVGVPIERRPWSPHLTVARARSATAQVSVACEALRDYTGPPWRVGEVTLVRSTTGPSPEYAVLDRMTFGA